MGERRNIYRVFGGKSEGKRLLGRPRHGLDSSGSGQGKVVNSHENSGFKKCMEFCDKMRKYELLKEDSNT